MEMELLFVGLIALGVAVSIVFSLKFLCFLGELLNTHYKWNSVINYFHVPIDDSPPDFQAISSNSTVVSNGQMDPIGIAVERIGSIYHKPVAFKPATHTASTSNETESPPTYEEALRSSSSNYTN